MTKVNLSEAPKVPQTVREKQRVKEMEGRIYSIDGKTKILVPAGKDPVKAVARYREKLNRVNRRTR